MFFFALTFIISFIALASSQGGSPKYYYYYVGYVDYPEKPEFNLIGIEITARLNSRDLGVVGYIDVDEFGNEGYYEAEIGRENGEITFYVGGVEAEPRFNQIVDSEFFKTIDLNLTIHSDPSRGLCGNGVINPGEECDGDNFGFFGDGVGQCQNYDSIYESGDLLCSEECKISASQCVLKSDDGSDDGSGSSGGDGGSGGGGGSGRGGGGSSGGGFFNRNSQNNEIVFLGDENKTNEEEKTQDQQETGETEGQNKIILTIKKFGPLLIAGFLIGLIVSSIVGRVKKKKNKS